MKRVVIVVGHSHSDQGAKSKDGRVSEYMYNDTVAQFLWEKFSSEDNLDLILKRRVTNYGNLPKEINSLNPDLIISLHCNAFNNEVNGTETLHYSGSTTGCAIAEIFQNQIIKTLKYKDRGLKPVFEGERGCGLLKRTSAPCIILEPFFIDCLSMNEIPDPMIMADIVKNSILKAVKVL